MLALKRAVGLFIQFVVGRSFIERSVFGDGLGSFRDSVFGQFSGQEETNGSLNLPRTDGDSFVDVRETRGFTCNLFKQIRDERVHDGHGLGGDSSVRMHLFQHLVQVNRVRFLPLLPANLLVTLHRVGLSLSRLLGTLSACLLLCSSHPAVDS